MLSFDEMIDEANKRKIEQAKEYVNNGRMCLQCGQYPGEPTSDLNPYHCVDCNLDTQDMLNELQGMGGFTHIKI
jgi:hypothetical protein